MPRTTIYFASDAHLGARFHEDSRAVERRLVRWLDSIKDSAIAVWFLGDMFDYWYEYKYVVPKGFTRFLGKVAELADSGVEIHFLTGNHDVWMFDYLPTELGATVHDGPVTIDLLGRRFFLGHGDEVDDRSCAFQLMRRLFRNRFCQWLYAGTSGCMQASTRAGRSASRLAGPSAVASRVSRRRRKNSRGKVRNTSSSSRNTT